MRILTEPRNAITQAVRASSSSLDKVELVFTEDALEAAAERALELQDGRARPAHDHRGGAARRDVRDPLAQRRPEVRHLGGYDQAGQGAATPGPLGAAGRDDRAARGPVGLTYE